MIKYITLGAPGVQGSQYLSMNRDSWDSLSPAQQAELEQVSGHEVGLTAAKEYAKGEEAGLALAKESGIEIIELSPQAAAEFEAASQVVYDEALAELEKQDITGGPDIITADQNE